VLSAVNSSAQRTVEQGTTIGSTGGRADDDGDGYAAMMQGALQQWQDLTNRMLDVFHQQFAAATGEIQRQGQRAFEQTSEATQSAARGVQAGAQQAEQGGVSGQPNSQSQGSRARSQERKHEMA
jgi:hypothetical protein